MPLLIAPYPAEFGIERRLKVFRPLLDCAMTDIYNNVPAEERSQMNIYITAKHGYVGPGVPGNRPGWHSDGFMTEDINYIWCDNNPTIFNTSAFQLTQHDEISLQEMEAQALPENDVTYAPFSLLKLDQYNIHRVPEITEPGMRTFVKISFSKDKYDLIGNSHNYELDYYWKMQPRQSSRNIPQSKITNQGL